MGILHSFFRMSGKIALVGRLLHFNLTVLWVTSGVVAFSV